MMRILVLLKSQTNWIMKKYESIMAVQQKNVSVVIVTCINLWIKVKKYNFSFDFSKNILVHIYYFCIGDNCIVHLQQQIKDMRETIINDQNVQEEFQEQMQNMTEIIANLKEIVNTLQNGLANAVSKNEMTAIKTRLSQCENKDRTQDTSLNTLKTELTSEISTVKNEFAVSLISSILTYIFLLFNNLYNL